MKIKHNVFFKSSKDSIIDWDKLRDDKSESAFYIPENKIDYIKLANSVDYENEKLEILSFCKEFNISRIISIGSGRCLLEYHLKKSSKLSVVVSDSSKSILRIKSFDLIDEALCVSDFTGVSNDYICEKTMFLLSRIDTEFDDAGLNHLIKSLYDNDVKYIYFIPAQILSLKTILIEIKFYIMSKFIKGTLVFCGYSRTKGCLRRILFKYYTFYKSSNRTDSIKLIKDN